MTIVIDTTLPRLFLVNPLVYTMDCAIFAQINEISGFDYIY